MNVAGGPGSDSSGGAVELEAEPRPKGRGPAGKAQLSARCGGKAATTTYYVEQDSVKTFPRGAGGNQLRPRANANRRRQRRRDGLRWRSRGRCPYNDDQSRYGTNAQSYHLD